MKNSNRQRLLKLFLYLTIFIVSMPLIILCVWVFVERWPWPNLLPESLSLRAIRQAISPHSKVFKTLLSSMSLSLTVSALSAVIAMMTSRALVFYDFKGKKLIEFLSISPIIVPGTVFAMGIHVSFIKMNLANTILGVIIVHLIYTLPYSINIMKDLTESIGSQMEIQSYVLGVSPVKSFIYITLPLLTPGILASISMAYISSFSQYFLTLLIGGGRVKTFTTLMVPFIAKGDRSLASTYAVIFMTSTLFIFILIDLATKNLDT